MTSFLDTWFCAVPDTCLRPPETSLTLDNPAACMCKEANCVHEKWHNRLRRNRENLVQTERSELKVPPLTATLDDPRTSGPTQTLTRNERITRNRADLQGAKFSTHQSNACCLINDSDCSSNSSEDSSSSSSSSSVSHDDLDGLVFFNSGGEYLDGKEQKQVLGNFQQISNFTPGTTDLFSSSTHVGGLVKSDLGEGSLKAFETHYRAPDHKRFYDEKSCRRKTESDTDKKLHSKIRDPKRNSREFKPNSSDDRQFSWNANEQISEPHKKPHNQRTRATQEMNPYYDDDFASEFGNQFSQNLNNSMLYGSRTRLLNSNATAQINEKLTCSVDRRFKKQQNNPHNLSFLSKIGKKFPSNGVCDEIPECSFMNVNRNFSAFNKIYDFDEHLDSLNNNNCVNINKNNSYLC